MIKGLLFDYGGTLDTNGRHWAAVIWEAYQTHHVGIDRRLFSKAYVYGERMLAINPIIKPEHTFLDVISLKLEQQFDYLEANGAVVERGRIPDIALMCEDIARNTVHLAELILNKLRGSYRMVIVSNFYGNLKTVLADFGILHFFDNVVESAVVGVRKPDAQIYRLGVDALGYAPTECLAIGDSYEKDMIPAKRAGCRTVWLNVEGWEESGLDEYQIVDAEINDLAKLLSALDQMNGNGKTA
ncbi:HAD family hydrolase [Parapedobacter sp. ISTM3]|uniref:Putative hydrolase of the HAD superfamily n=1 Tax=Parapedobacter luteus TaxID=623280 RepID=A0A1T5A1K6_9SPHI|nr:MULTISPECIES: HAD family hydrolase [Parapedobacter]MBK1440054.1 HAD family hydrolase [Parapedobacter sp. ISTM3]SKB28882.1 putative hydrolase of the HAD superfamily [Parapedobacter luteus]